MPVSLVTSVGSGNILAVIYVLLAELMLDTTVLALPPVNVTLTPFSSITSLAVATALALLDVTLDSMLFFNFKNITFPVSVVVRSPSVSA